MRAILTTFDEKSYSCKDTLFVKEKEMSDTFRKDYKQLNEKNADMIKHMKIAFEQVEMFMLPVKSREMSLALTNLEQACMWATKAIVLEDEKNGSNPI